jgi:hypothetical protein
MTKATRAKKAVKQAMEYIRLINITTTTEQSKDLEAWLDRLYSTGYEDGQIDMLERQIERNK